VTSRCRIRAVELALRGHPYDDLDEILDYWDAKRGDRFAPARADIEPLDLKSAMSRIVLLDVIADPFDVRFRLVGTHVAGVQGFDATGISVRDMRPQEYAELIFGHYAACVERKAPSMHLIYLDTFGRSMSYARLALPLSEDAKTVTMLMAVSNRDQNSQDLRAYFEEMQQLPVG